MRGLLKQIRIGPVTWTILAVCVAIETASQLSDHGLIEFRNLRQLGYYYGGFWPGLLGTWRPNYAAQPFLMFVTYGFLHLGASHLLINMSLLILLGRMVSDRIGQWRLAAVYAISLLGGACAFGFLTSGLVPMVGASGALFGLSGAIVGWEFLDRRRNKEPLLPVIAFIAGFGALNLVHWWAMNGQLAWQTHLGGFLAGFVAALYFDRPRTA